MSLLLRMQRERNPDGDASYVGVTEEGSMNFLELCGLAKCSPTAGYSDEELSDRILRYRGKHISATTIARTRGGSSDE